MCVSIRGGSDQLVIEVAANERHERATGRMNPANRQPSGNLGDLWVIATQNSKLQLGRGFDREAGVLLSKPCRLRLAVAVDAEQNDRRRRGRCWMLRSCGHDELLELKRDPQWVPGFRRYGLLRRRLKDSQAELARNAIRHTTSCKIILLQPIRAVNS